MLRLFIVVEDPQSGVLVKVPGSVAADPQTGQLTATFLNNPQLPFEDLKLAFKGGFRASLATPQSCGTFTSTSKLTPWSAPQSGPDSVPSDSFTVNAGPNGTACVSAPWQLPFAPSFSAGTVDPQASAFSPFELDIFRQDTDQQLSTVALTLPPGLLAKLAGVPRCPDADASAGTCPASSRVGSVTTGAGPGSHPFFVSGQVYLTGPYNGGPFGLVVQVPAIAGPFNLGTVVVRQSLRVDPHTAQASVLSDPLPSILDGIPLQVRTINVRIDRLGFTLNPTSCDPMRIAGVLTSLSGRAAPAESRFQAANCARLPFKPVFSAATAGTGNLHGASLDVKIAQRSGESRIRKVDTQLPLALPSRLVTLQKACTESQFATNPAGCPAGSAVGIATAATPLLDAPLTGPAYLVSHGGAAFPDLDFVLQGEGVTIVLVGNTDIKKGITFSRFDTVPDAPINSFELKLPAGAGALLAATRNLCSTTRTVSLGRRVTRRVRGRVVHVMTRVTHRLPEPLVMPTTITGQNGVEVSQATRIAVTGCPKHAPRTHTAAKGRRHTRPRWAAHRGRR
jgi:hypothetical protein